MVKRGGGKVRGRFLGAKVVFPLYAHIWDVSYPEETVSSVLLIQNHVFANYLLCEILFSFHWHIMIELPKVLG